MKCLVKCLQYDPSLNKHVAERKILQALVDALVSGDSLAGNTALLLAEIAKFEAVCSCYVNLLNDCLF